MRLSYSFRSLLLLFSLPLLVSGCNVDQLLGALSPATVITNPTSLSLVVKGQSTVVAQAFNAAGSPLPGYLAMWSSADTTIATVTSAGKITAIAPGTTKVKATMGSVTGNVDVLVSPVVVASVLVAPDTATMAAASTRQFTATPRDSAATALSGRVVTWSSSNVNVATVSTTGVVTAVASGTSLISATSEGKTGSGTVTVPAATTPLPPPPPTPTPSTGTVALQVARTSATTGPVLVSSAVPLPPGRLKATDLANVKLLVAGVEPAAVYMEALSGTHADGSVRAVLVQFTYDVPATPVAGQLVFGQLRTAPALAKPTADRGSPVAVVLPTDPAYLISTQLVGPTVPAAETAALPAPFAKYEADFRTFADKHWALNGALWTENYYDRAQIYYAWWIRTGTLEYWKRATAMAVTYRRDYLELNAYNSSAHWYQPEGLELHYLLTGDEASRTAVGRVADVFNVPYYMLNLGDVTAEMENRMQARTLMAYLTAWKLNAPSPLGAAWATLLPVTLTKILASQDAAGAYRFTRVTNQCGYNKPFMVGLLNDAFIKYHTYFAADARILPAIQKSVDYMWTNDWRPAGRGFVYLDGPCPGYDELQAISPDLNNLIVNGYAWVYQQTKTPAYRDQADQIFAGGVDLSWLAGTKQFNEEYSTSFRYLSYRGGTQRAGSPEVCARGGTRRAHGWSRDDRCNYRVSATP
jgi:hypothetical protein